MIGWEDEGIVLSLRPHGETGRIAHVLTAAHGRHAGLVSGSGRRDGLEIGCEVRAAWQARLSDHLGRFSLEVTASHAGRWFADPQRLAAVASACAVTDIVLPEREPQPGVYAGLLQLLALLDHPLWAAIYVRWELGLLDALGFGLDLSNCAVTGGQEDLVFVSPRTGRAVSAEAAEPYRDRLLPLPGFLVGGAEPDDRAIAAGLRLCAHFLERHVMHPMDRQLPAARLRLADGFAAADCLGGDGPISND